MKITLKEEKNNMKEGIEEIRKNKRIQKIGKDENEKYAKVGKQSGKGIPKL